MLRKRNQLLPLTETMFYVLLALRSPRHGYHMMQTMKVLSDGAVRIAAGTMYGALENLSKRTLIVAVASEDPRRKIYQITALGEEILAMDIERLQHMVKAAKKKG